MRKDMKSNQRAASKVEDDAELAYGTIVMLEQMLQGRKLPSVALQAKYGVGLSYLDQAMSGRVGTTRLDATARVDLFEAALASLRPVLANYMTTEKDWMEVIVRPELLRWRKALQDAKAEERVERTSLGSSLGTSKSFLQW
jgi:hypothetical protein